MDRLRADLCERVRALVSLELDGEASQLETAIVDAHVADCSDCHEFHTRVAGFTDALRTAVLEAPDQRARIALRPGLGSARSRLVRSLSMASATAVAAAAGFAAIVALGDRDILGPDAGLFPRPAATPAQEQWQRNLVLLQRARATKRTGGAASASAPRVS